MTVVLLMFLSFLFNNKHSESKTEHSAKTADVQLPNPNFHIYLCFGQSNMEGQGEIDAQDLIVDNRLKVLQSVDCPKQTKNKWRTAVPPLCFCNTGLSLADNFGKTMIASLPDSVSVGLVVVAVGGCDIRLFDKDLYTNYRLTYNESWFTEKINAYNGNPYQHLLHLAQLAQKDGVIKGILLHQGETNTGDSKWPQYVKAIYNNLMTDLSLNPNQVPLLAGQVVHSNQHGMCASMNQIIDKLPETIPTAHVISSDACAVSIDNVHFSASGYRELGRRYAEKMLTLLK